MFRGGKSGLTRAQRRVTPGPLRRQWPSRGTDSATEKIPPGAPRTGGKHSASESERNANRRPEGPSVRVKRRGKSPPRSRQRERHGKPRCEQGQAMESCSLAQGSYGEIVGQIPARESAREGPEGLRAIHGLAAWNRRETVDPDGWRRPRKGYRTRLTDLPFFCFFRFD